MTCRVQNAACVSLEVFFKKMLFGRESVRFLACARWCLRPETIVEHRSDHRVMSWRVPPGRMCLKWLIAALLCTPSLGTSPALSKDKHITNAVKTWHWKTSGALGSFWPPFSWKLWALQSFNWPGARQKPPLYHRPLLLHFSLHNQHEITAWWYMAKWSGWCGW